MVPGTDFIVLPLYATKGGEKVVNKSSGINTWNSGGRNRRFGEAYISVPRIIHEKCPEFFPKNGESFGLILPKSKQPISASLCQQNYKSLMTKPNYAICQELFKLIDKKLTAFHFKEGYTRDPFSYEDLLRIGLDSVILKPVGGTKFEFYSLEFSEVGSWEIFLENISK
jgi:hypothetical protein